MPHDWGQYVKPEEVGYRYPGQGRAGGRKVKVTRSSTGGHRTPTPWIAALGDPRHAKFRDALMDIAAYSFFISALEDPEDEYSRWDIFDDVMSRQEVKKYLQGTFWTPEYINLEFKQNPSVNAIVKRKATDADHIQRLEAVYPEVAEGYMKERHGDTIERSVRDIHQGPQGTQIVRRRVQQTKRFPDDPDAPDTLGEQGGGMLGLYNE